MWFCFITLWLVFPCHALKGIKEFVNWHIFSLRCKNYLLIRSCVILKCVFPFNRYLTLQEIQHIVNWLDLMLFYFLAYIQIIIFRKTFTAMNNKLIVYDFWDSLYVSKNNFRNIKFALLCVCICKSVTKSTSIHMLTTFYLAATLKHTSAHSVMPYYKILYYQMM